jgi:hypothetical protein
MKQIIYTLIDFKGKPQSVQAVADYVVSDKCKINFETTPITQKDIKELYKGKYPESMLIHTEEFGIRSKNGLGSVSDGDEGAMFLINRDRHPFEAMFDLSATFPDILFKVHYHGSNYGVVYDIYKGKVLTQQCCQPMEHSDELYFLK